MFLKQIIVLKSFNSVFKMVDANIYFVVTFPQPTYLFSNMISLVFENVFCSV